MKLKVRLKSFLCSLAVVLAAVCVNGQPIGGAGEIKIAATGPGTYTFSVPNAGNYTIWGQVKRDKSGGKNSFFYSIDGGAQTIWHTAGGEPDGELLWHPVTDSPADGTQVSPKTFSLAAGQHELKLIQREAGTFIDGLVIMQASNMAQETLTPPQVVKAATVGLQGFDVYTYVAVTGGTFNVAWDAVTNANYYEVKLHNLERKVDGATQRVNAPATQAAMKVVMSGRSVARARACIDATKCSEWATSDDPKYASVNGASKGWWIFAWVGAPGNPTIN
jgi:hypothetical protein